MWIMENLWNIIQICIIYIRLKFLNWLSEQILLFSPLFNQPCILNPQMAANSDEEHHSTPYKQKDFTWGYDTNTYWKTVKVHPESGCSMVTTNITHSDTSPCATERQLSLACLEEGYGRERCQPYFENYRTCVKYWRQVVRRRKSHGKEDALSAPDLREQMRKEFRSSVGN